MMMRFHGGMAVGHFSCHVAGTDLPHSQADSEVPMDVDTPEGRVSEVGAVAESEGSSESSGEESDGSSSCLPEPDSEEDSDIYL